MAWLIGKTTEDLATHTGEIAGGLINATFGNVVEMLLCAAGIHQNQLAVVKCTLVGSILSNLLLVMGTSFAWGGYWYHTQKFSSAGAGAHTSLMLLSVLALTLPTTYSSLLGAEVAALSIGEISRGCSLMLLFVYVQYLYFELQTHKDLFEDSSSDKSDDDEEADLTMPVAITILATCTILTAFCSEYLISSIEGTIESWKISKEFIGIIILPIIGNAAEHYTAIVVAGRNKMDLSLGVAVGSSCQMAMLVTPFCVLVGWYENVDMSLDFHPFQVVVLLLSVLIVANVINDGQSNWLEGSMLITAYALIATMYLLQNPEGEPSTINA
jgi:Ca2+:H+ antiporter